MRSARWLPSVIALACIGLAVPALAGSASAAKTRIMQAQDFADKGQKDDALDKLKEAETFLDGLSDDEKAPIVKDITDLRAKLNAAGSNSGGGSSNSGSGNSSAGAANGTSGSGNVDPEMADRVRRNVERYLTFSEQDVDSNPSSASDEFDQAVNEFNKDDTQKNLTADARTTLQARIDALQAKIKGAKKSEAARQFTDRVQREFDGANNSVNDPEFAHTRLEEARSLLASDEARQKLDPDAIQKLQSGLAQAESTLADATKKDALSRADRLFGQLDEKIATDPFKGVASDTAYKVTEDLQSYTMGITAQLNRLLENDADRKSYNDRLTAAQAKIDGYDAAWASANVEAAVVNRWKFAQEGFVGWDSETYAPSDRPFAPPVLPKTENAAQLTQQFLGEKETVDAGRKPADLPQAAAAIAEAQKTLTDAQAKLNAAFNQWMDAAEQQPRPQGAERFNIDAAGNMARWADSRLAGSPYHDADVARAKKLDQRWQDELAAIKQQHEEWLRKNTADASAAWPGISSSIDAQDDFHPSDVDSAKGKTFRFQHVRNRSGWDFDGQYDLVMWVDGQPVAGNYTPAIKQAFADAARQIGDSVDDHIDWDVIATVEGRGEANRRFTATVKDEQANELGKIEGTHLVDCVVVRVIAIHAGPIAMGGK